MQLFLKSLGCRLNEAELENWAAAFQAQGHTLLREPAHADIIILNTCAVTREAVKKSRQLIRKSHRYNPRAKLIVSGCYPSLFPEIDKELVEIDLLIANQDKDRLPEIIQEQLLSETMPARATLPGFDTLNQRGRTRAFIKIQDGCRYRCTFCIVTAARGPERSRPVANIVEQINRMYMQGVKEAVLTGVHVGGYGSDIGSDLQSLIRAILDQTEIPRIRLASVEPWDLPEDFFELFENNRLMPHLHLPLQSGSDAVLKTMARRCRTADYARLIGRARAVIPDFNVSTDVIVGFPGETDSDWEKSVEFIESIGFYHVHIFPYSARPGTKAATLPDHIAPTLKKDRCRQLVTLANQMKKRCLQRQLGKHKEVLIEQNRHACTGYTPDYLRVEIESVPPHGYHNEIKRVTIVSLNTTEDSLTARLS